MLERDKGFCMNEESNVDVVAESEKKVVTEFTVKRSEWLRGEGHAPSALFRKERGKRCCLGFFCNAYGYTDEEIVDVPATWSSSRMGIDRKAYDVGAVDLARLPLPFLSEGVPDHSFVGDIVNMNDIEGEGYREERLKELFAILGITVNFVD